jgi:tight adherence protein B
MVRSLRVGHPFIVGRATPSPRMSPTRSASELGHHRRRGRLWRDVSESIRAMADRLDIQDLRFLAVAVGIQQTSGGNLAEILQGLSKVIRARFKLFRKVKAITSEAKWSGTFLSFFPIVLALVGINVMQPTTTTT